MSTTSRLPAAAPAVRPTAPPRTSPEQERADRELLSGPAAEQLLRAVLDAEGVRLSGWSLHQVQHRPGVGVTAGWTVRWALDGRQGEEYLLATTCPVPPGTPGATTATLAGRDVVVWRHPADPHLPGLPLATDRDRVARDVDLDPTRSTLTLVTYRPLRRAVLRVHGPDLALPDGSTTVDGSARTRTVYVKVVRPDRAGDLARRHVLLLDAGVPAAPCTDLGDGVLRLDELTGTPLTDLLARDGAADVDPAAVVDVLDRMPVELVAMPRRPSWPERVGHHAAAAAAAVPDRAGEILAVADEAERLMAASDPGPVVPTHGDLHEANLLMRDGRVVGLLDVDSAGPGHRVDDLACLLGHMSVLPALAPDVHRHVPAALPRWVQAFDGLVDPVALRARTAAVVLSLVAGARRDDGQEWRADADGRLAAARRWVSDAAATAEVAP